VAGCYGKGGDLLHMFRNLKRIIEAIRLGEAQKLV
jgi:hypothetical protein